MVTLFAVADVVGDACGCPQHVLSVFSTCACAFFAQGLLRQALVALVAQLRRVSVGVEAFRVSVLQRGHVPSADREIAVEAQGLQPRHVVYPSLALGVSCERVGRPFGPFAAGVCLPL